MLTRKQTLGNGEPRPTYDRVTPRKDPSAILCAHYMGAGLKDFSLVCVLPSEGTQASDRHAGTEGPLRPGMRGSLPTWLSSPLPAPFLPIMPSIISQSQKKVCPSLGLHD